MYCGYQLVLCVCVCVCQECTVYIRWETDRKKSPGLTEEALKVAFARFGTIQTVLMRSPEE